MTVTPKKNEKETNREYALRVLEENIISLELAPGDKISETEIAKELNLSRTPIREAFIELEGVNILEIRPQIGTFISLIDLDLVEEARFLRLILEKEISRILCEIEDSFMLMPMEEQLFKQRLCLEHNKRREFYGLDNQFHKTLAAIANRSRSYELIHNIQIHFDRIRKLNLKRERCQGIYQQHKSIADAIKEHDAEKAANIITNHLSNYETDLEKLKKIHPEYIKED